MPAFEPRKVFTTLEAWFLIRELNVTAAYMYEFVEDIIGKFSAKNHQPPIGDGTL
jgi:hypothetical protein